MFVFVVYHTLRTKIVTGLDIQLHPASDTKCNRPTFNFIEGCKDRVCVFADIVWLAADLRPCRSIKVAYHEASRRLPFQVLRAHNRPCLLDPLIESRFVHPGISPQLPFALHHNGRGWWCCPQPLQLVVVVLPLGPHLVELEAQLLHHHSRRYISGRNLENKLRKYFILWKKLPYNNQT